MGGVGGRRSDANRLYREGRQGPWGKRGHYFRHHSRPGISLEGGQRPVCTGRSPSRPMGGRADRAFGARAGAHHREKLASLGDLAGLEPETARTDRSMHDLPGQSRPFPQLSSLPGQGVSHRHWGDRRGLPLSGERSHGDHGGQVGPGRRRSRSHAPSACDQWRFRCVLGVPRNPGVSTQSPGQIRRDAHDPCPPETCFWRKKGLPKQGWIEDWKTRVGGVVSKKTHPCQSDQIVKRGKTARGTQRYLCQHSLCAKGSFLLDYCNRGCLPEVKQTIINMSLNASGVRDTARSLHICPNTVLRELKKKEAALESVNTALRRTLNPEKLAT